MRRFEERAGRALGAALAGLVLVLELLLVVGRFGGGADRSDADRDRGNGGKPLDDLTARDG
nr:hypothetical protein [Vulcanimicrobium alpinum]